MAAEVGSGGTQLAFSTSHSTSGARASLSLVVRVKRCPLVWFDEQAATVNASTLRLTGYCSKGVPVEQQVDMGVKPDSLAAFQTKTYLRAATEPQV